MTLFLILILITIIFLISEYWIVHRAVNKIPLRILVNGTRGKSTIVKYISAGLRSADKKVVAKITGVIPTIINPDGSEKIIKRIGPARIQEQFKMMRFASKLSCDCLILECMSINPELQKLESQIFKPNIYIITNIRDDHREQLGEIESQVNTFCNAIPPNSTVITSEQKYLNEITRSSASKGSKVIFVNNPGLENSSEADYFFPSNLNIAVAACCSAAFDKEKVTKSIGESVWNEANPFIELNLEGKNIRFINGFAVNDVESAADFLIHWERRLGSLEKLNIIFNSRYDRPLRSISFAKWISSINILDKIIVTGSHIPRTKFELQRNGIEQQRIVIWNRKRIKGLLEGIKTITEDNTIFMGLGNISGNGLRIVDTFENLQLSKNTL